MMILLGHTTKTNKQTRKKEKRKKRVSVICHLELNFACGPMGKKIPSVLEITYNISLAYFA